MVSSCCGLGIERSWRCTTYRFWWCVKLPVKAWHAAEVMVSATDFGLMEFFESGINDGYGALIDEVRVTLVPCAEVAGS
jgi:hypothetical protein